MAALPVGIPLLLVSDIDDTLVGHGAAGADAALGRFSELWTERRAAGCVLVYNTGRSVDSYKQLLQEFPLLPTPDVFVGSVGTQMIPVNDPDDEALRQLCSQAGRSPRSLPLLELSSSSGLLAVEVPTVPNPLKHTLVVTGEAESTQISEFVKRSVEQSGFGCEVVVCSAGHIGEQKHSVDIVPEGAGKGTATEFIRNGLGVCASRTLVAGNDILMFRTGMNKGVIVANAKPELLRFHENCASEHGRIVLSAHNFADGVIDGVSRMRA